MATKIQSLDRSKVLSKLMIKSQELKCLEYRPFDYQLKVHKSTSPIVFLRASNQSGKGNVNGTLIPTINGYKKIEEFKVGDTVFGLDGKEHVVNGVYPKEEIDCYKVTFDDGASTIVDKDHLWICKTEKERFIKQYKSRNKIWDNPEYNKWQVLSIEEIIKSGSYSPFPIRRGKAVSIPISEPVEYSEINLKLPPYFLGLILGDGSIREENISYCSSDQELLEYVTSITGNSGYKAKNRNVSTIPCGKLKDNFKELNLLNTLSGTKFIPKSYLQGSIQQRKDLLAGLMDTDGASSKTGYETSYCTISEQLKDDFIELINSLGGVVNGVQIKDAFYYLPNRERKYCNKAYVIRFKVLFNPYKLQRKADRWKPVTKYKHERIIQSIELVGKFKSTCISVDSEDHSYLCVKNYIVTHNSLCAIREALFWFRGYHPYKKLAKNRELVIWVCSDTLGTCIDALYVNKIQKMIPEKEYTEIKNASVGLVGIRHKLTKSVIMFKGYAKGATRLQSVPVDLVVIDEQPGWEEFMELLQRTTATKGQIYMTFTPLQVDNNLKKFIVEGEVEEFHVTAYDVPIRTKEEIDQKRKILPDRDFRVRYLGEWASFAGALIPSFSDKNIVNDFDVPKHWRHVLAVDAASSGYVGIALLAQSPTDKLWYVIKESMPQNIEPNRLVQYCEEFCEGRNVTDRFSDIHETWFIKIANNVQNDLGYRGVKKVKKEDMTVELDNSFAAGRVFVFAGLLMLQDQIYNYKNKEESNKFDPLRGDYHILDAVIYANRMLYSLADLKEKEEEKSPFWKAIDKQFFSPKKVSQFAKSL